jgi:ribosomal protein S18 acetylase RimI-like enzyme
MSTAYHFSDATGYTHYQLAEFHTASFEGYDFPMQITAAQSADFWRTNQIDANRCVIMHDKAGSFVGMARMGTRGLRGCCGGFGITPEFRGTGASTLLAAEMVRVARESGLKSLQLEVLTQNIKAIKTYEKAGFAITRQLYGLELENEELPQVNASKVEKVAVEELLIGQKLLTQPWWGNELPTLLTQTVEAYALTDATGNTHGLFVREARGNRQVMAAVSTGELSKAELIAMLCAVVGNRSKIQIFNEPEESRWLDIYRELGFTEYFSQYEMTLEL